MPLLVSRLLSSLRTTTRLPIGSMMSNSVARFLGEVGILVNNRSNGTVRRGRQLPDIVSATRGGSMKRAHFCVYRVVGILTLNAAAGADVARPAPDSTYEIVRYKAPAGWKATDQPGQP